jgi:hypothetical protein
MPWGPFGSNLAKDESAGRPRQAFLSRKVRTPKGGVVGNAHPG